MAICSWQTFQCASSTASNKAFQAQSKPPVLRVVMIYSEKNESEIKGVEVEIIMVEGENTTKLKYNSLKTNKVSTLLFLK